MLHVNFVIAVSKIKIAILSAFVGAAAMAVWVFVQQQTINALRQENEQLKTQAAQTASLQDQLTHATQDAATASGNAETQAHELAKLRGEVGELRSQAKELAGARQEIQNLNDRMAAAEQGHQEQVAALQAAVQNNTRALSQQEILLRHQNSCINNLRLIDSAKQQWALEFKKGANDVPTADDLRPYLGRGPQGELPTCPDGGTYTFGTVNDKPVCSVNGHVLP